MFLHGSAWQSKLWPEAYWVRLTRIAADQGYEVRFPWGSESERLRAKRIIAAAGSGVMLAQLELAELSHEIAESAGAVGGDSGLSHLAAAFGIPVVVVYGPTDTHLTGAIGERCVDLGVNFSCAPCFLKECSWQDEAEVEPACFAQLTPERVWESLQQACSR